jgi:gliding motility-associated-like protein
MKIGLRGIAKNIFAFVLLICPSLAVAQTYTDGPIQLQVRLREFRYNPPGGITDVNLSAGSIYTPPAGALLSDEVKFKIWARDNANVDAISWGPLGGTCNAHDFTTANTNSVDFNQTFFNFTYPGGTVPRYFDLRIAGHEDDNSTDYTWLPNALSSACEAGNPCDYNPNTCCATWPVIGGCIFDEEDDIWCDAQPFRSAMDYRLGPPCQWYDHGFVNGTGCTDATMNGAYSPHVQSFWRYTRGDNCGNSIQLGNVLPGFPLIQHYNSNECYGNTYPTSVGNDVWYSITVTQPVGITATLCAAATYDTYLYLLDGCTPVTDVIASNNDFCGNTSQVSSALCTPGTYYIVVDANTASTGTFTLTIQETPSLLPTADAGPSISNCIGTGDPIGGSPSASGGSGGYTYTWSPGTGLSATNIANPYANPTVTTPYTLTVTDSQGCTVTDVVTVTVTPGPVVNFPLIPTQCIGTSVNLNAGAGYSNYFWNTGATTQSISVTSPGTYTVSVIDNFGCLGGGTRTVNYYTVPTINVGADTAVCQGQSLTLDAGAGMNSYAWSNGAFTQTTNITTSGTYTVTVGYGSSCTTTDAATVTVNPLPAITLGADVTVCPGISATLDPGPGFPVYDWSTTSNNQTESVSTPGNYSVTVTDVNGCQDADTVSLANYAAPVVSISGNLSYCEGASTTLDAGVWNSYDWNTTASTQTISVSSPGTYEVTITDANSCEGIANVVVTENPLPVISLGNDTILCDGNTVALNAGAGFTSYNWTGGATTAGITATTSGNYSVTVTDANTCVGTDDINVTVNAPLGAFLGNDTTICDQGNLMLDAGAGLQSYLWNDGSQNQYLFVSTPGNYSVTVMDAFGCTGNDQIDVTLSGLVNANLFGNDTSLCIGTQVLLDAGNPYITYLWNDGSQDQYLMVDSAGTYFVEVKDAQGCRLTDSVSVAVIVPPSLDLGPGKNICDGQIVTLDAGAGFNTYLWNSGDVTQTLAVNAIGNYSVTVTFNICTATDEVNVTDECGAELFIPNVFTPNDDGFNDLMKLVGQNLESYHLWLFDRWGNQLFESADINSSWDGNTNGKAVPDGVYYYRVEYKFIGSEVTEEKKGNVTVVR